MNTPQLFPQGILQITWTQIKEKRNALLAETDWSVSNDTPLSDLKVQEYKTYRQALRNIPQMYSDPSLVVWPIKPS